jgi:DNA-binding MarR family transcriptional regulator
MRPSQQHLQPVLLAKAVAEHFEHLSRSLYSLSFCHGLNPAQWNALRFLARANPGARTMSAFSKFHVTTKSTASQTIAALVRKRLVRKARDPEDGRVVRLDVTSKGLQLLQRDPVNCLISGLAGLPLERLRTVAESLENLTRSVAANGARRRDR